jgi:hypothetical protein
LKVGQAEIKSGWGAPLHTTQFFYRVNYPT